MGYLLLSSPFPLLSLDHLFFPSPRCSSPLLLLCPPLSSRLLCFHLERSALLSEAYCICIRLVGGSSRPHRLFTRIVHRSFPNSVGLEILAREALLARTRRVWIYQVEGKWHGIRKCRLVARILPGPNIIISTTNVYKHTFMKKPF